MRKSSASTRPPFTPGITRSLPAGAGFLIAGAVSLLFWAAVAGIAVIV